MPDSKSLLDALLAVQQEAPVLRKTATNPHFRNTYAPLEEIVATVNPILHKHQLVWSTLPVNSDYGPALTYRLSHVPSGDTVEGTMPLLLSKEDAQGQGSAITYARRYALCAVLNLVADDDDDGARASTADDTQVAKTRGAPKPSEKQVEFLHSMVKQKKPTVGQLRRMLADVGAEHVEVEEGWAQRLSGGRDGQVSLLIERLKDGELPLADEPVEVPVSDVPGAGEGEFVHLPADGSGTPFDVSS